MPENKLILIVAAECTLTNAPMEVVNFLKKKLTLPNPKYQAAQKYSRWGVGRKFPRHLYYYRERKAGLIMPRGVARDAVLACLDICGAKPTIIDRRRLLPPVSFSFKGQLRDYQQAAVDDILGRDFGVLEAGTGSGKTVMALHAIARRGQPALVIVHTKELMFQWAEKIGEFMGLEAGMIGDGRYSITPITVAIVNSARKHLTELPQLFGHILVDECHRVPASLFTDVITAFDAQYSLGLSATAYRRDDVMTKLIYFYLGRRAHRVDPRKLQESGAVLKPEIIFRPTSFTYNYRDDYAAMMSCLTLDDERNRLIAADVIKEAKSGRTILVVSDRVEHCERLAELIEDQGGSPAILTGRVKTEDRTGIVAGVRDKRVKILVATVQLIGEGFDAPGLASLFLATPIKFSGRVLQTIGRILRPEEGKKAFVFDYLDPVGVLESSAKARQRIYNENF
jgi:superfamily II DNA or RNA helicase